MKIGQPVKEIPLNARKRWGKYKEIWNTVTALPNGDWLPVQCATAKEANNLYFAAHTHRTLMLTAKRIENVVYIQRKA